ncbi:MULTISPECIES: DUF1294 domain-containing protein [Cytobacillus]|uniref:DUF1294 domain-containing protein n=1 Tax=Cytobacillus TaxID=2675230 RepID=UPI001CD7BDA7|nr:DUF1294 domain-containing protein [Cytobacillus kochii]MCA1025229.1 DUF1294 domain-containing protein [Cytobacillus kochii]MCM3323138.1 DUF1294 domain-containing protein [Cytobacillus kochii]MCM3345533.1 DUF1294 domain-containing protein [Cytobacillus kochii]MDM5208727.1 DUF1294 domain-containing protein [Cytobacillus kochii]
MIFAIIIVFFILNGIAAIMMKIDKRKAQRGEYRISEQNLWLVALLFGAIGMTWGMRRYRHKTKHFSFKLGLPILSVLQLIFLVYLIMEWA